MTFDKTGRSPSNAVEILVEPSDYVLRNVGDMAMLFVAVERLAELRPHVVVRVLTRDPEGLRRHCPRATPEPDDGRRLWLYGESVRSRAESRLRGVVPSTALRHALAGLLVRRWRAGLTSEARAALNRYLELVDSCDLVVVAGMGGITDAFPDYAREVLLALKLALRSPRPVAMMGQGLGPLADPALRALAASVLPRLHLVALRECLAGPPLLRELGVSEDRFIVTGDDAVEMANTLRSSSVGTGLGINVRLSDYASTMDIDLSQLGAAFTATACALQCSLVALPVSSVPGEADLDTLHKMGIDAIDDAATPIVMPADLVRRIQSCRIVVTGSYHAGVFALSAGIPVIGLVASAYYRDKFRGLAAMFGDGCAIIELGDAGHTESLRAAMLDFWSRADELKELLLERARSQIDAGRAAYRKLGTAIAAPGVS